MAGQKSVHVAEKLLCIRTLRVGVLELLGQGLTLTLGQGLDKSEGLEQDTN